MLTEKNYIHDRLILLLTSIEVFLALLIIVTVLLRLENGATSGGFITQYRPVLGIGAFKTGSRVALLGFPLFAVLVVAGHVGLSIRTYRIRRQLSVAILVLGIVLLGLGLIVGNALLALH